MRDLSIENINTVMGTALEIADAMKNWSDGGSEVWEKLLNRFKDHIFSCDPMLIALAVTFLTRNDVSMTAMREVMTPDEWEAFKRGIRPITASWVGTEPPIGILKKIVSNPDPEFFLDTTMH